MKQEVEVSTRAELARVWIDGVQLRLKSGVGSTEVRPGNHVLSWAVRGAPGTTYHVKITAPDEAKLVRGDTFDDDQFDAGVAWFKVNE
jgi:hypothetical protein